MKIIGLSLENFRSFEEKTQLDNIKPISVFVGANNVGKSNIIEFLKFLKNMTSKSWSKTFEEIIFDQKDKTIKLELEVELTESERRKIINLMPQIDHVFTKINFKEDKIFNKIKYITEIDKQGPINERLYLSDNGGNYCQILSHLVTNNVVERSIGQLQDHFKAQNSYQNLSQIRVAKFDQKSRERFGLFEPRNPNIVEYKILEFLVNFLQAIKVIGLPRHADLKMPGGEHKQLEDSGKNLIGVMTTILSSDSGEFVRIMNSYKKIVSGIESINVPPIGADYTMKIKEQGLDSQIDFANISTGLHQSLILFMVLERAAQGQIICVEEPEIHLHASSQKRLLRYLHTKTEKNQFFFTTHSSVFTSMDDKTSTFLITKNNGRSKITPIEKREDLIFVKQQLGIRNSDVYSNDYTLFVEGESEEVAFPIVAKALNFEKFGNEVNLVNLKGDSKILKLELFLEYLKTQDTEAFLVADGSSKVGKKIIDFIKSGLIKESHTKLWEKEFEDTFTSDKIVKAMNVLHVKHSFKFDMTVAQLEKERQSNKKVPDIINKYFQDNEQPKLVKIDLARELALDVLHEIQTLPDREKTVFETEVERIKKLVDSYDEPNSEIQNFDIENMPDHKKLKIREYIKKIFGEV